MTGSREQTLASDAADDGPVASGSPGTVVRLGRLLALARPEWPTLVVGTIFLFIGSGMGLVYPQAVRVFLDDALLEADLEMVDAAALALVGVFGIQAIAVALRYYLFTVAGERIVTQLRGDLFHSVLAQEIGFFDARRTGELTNRLASDTAVLQNTVSVNISMALRSAATCLGALALLIYTSHKLTLVTVTLVPPVVLGAVIAGRMIRKLSRKTQDALAQAGEVAEESISGVRTVRAFAQEEREKGRYRTAIWHSFELARQRVRLVGWFQGIVSCAGFGSLAIVLWYGGHLVIAGELSIGEVTAFILYTGVVAMSLGTLASLWTDFMRAVGAGDRVFDLMDRTPLIPTVGGATLERVAGQLEFRAVRFLYPTRPDVVVLDGVSLMLNAGERVALVGPSGGGKSTIAGLIPRFYDPEAGSVRLDGRDLRELDPTWLRQQIGTVAQEPILFSTSIAENISYGASSGGGEVAVADIEAAARTANAHQFVSDFPDGYQTLVGERGVQLSGGQKQRVAIARAVLRDPRILILDEATSALDSESEHLVKQALERLMEGRTTLIIAHRLSTVMDADRVLVIDNGRIVQAGPHRQLMEEGDGLYRRLVEHQFVEA